MRRKSFWNVISVFGEGLSAAEWTWRIVVFVFVGAGGTVTAFVAKADPVLKALGPIYWIGVGAIGVPGSGLQ